MLKLVLAASALAGVSSAGQVMTSLSFQGSGFPDGVFKAHLHASTCANDGGGHYQHNGEAVDAVNENWPAVTCMSGKCTGAASNMWAPAAAAVASGLSIVVHDTMAASSGSGAKMLCADLVGSAGEYSGEIAYLASFTGAGYSATGYGSIRKGEASMSFAGTTTAISFKGTGFPDGVFKSHLHAADCASGSGGHYQHSGVTVDAINENWPEVTCANSKCNGMAGSDWVPSVAELATGLSLVIHDTPAASSGSGSKMLCADLIRSGQGMYSGKLSYLAAYTGTGYGDIEKDSATLMKPELMTMASFKGSGFPDSTFNTHLHADTCANGGGGHYQYNGATVDAVNENWPVVSCSDGMCSGMAANDWWIPAADLAGGLSIVIHDTPNNGGSGSGPKMMCADLTEKNGKFSGKFSYLEAFAGAGYGKSGQSVATLAYGMGGGKGRSGGGKTKTGGGEGGKRGSSGGKRNSQYSSLGSSHAAMVNKASIAGAAVGAGLLVVAAALFAMKKRSTRVSNSMESEALL